MPLGRFPDASVSIGPDPGRTLCISLISSRLVKKLDLHEFKDLAG
jgi:hypothetical protein